MEIQILILLSILFIFVLFILLLYFKPASPSNSILVLTPAGNSLLSSSTPVNISGRMVTTDFGTSHVLYSSNVKNFSIGNVQRLMMVKLPVEIPSDFAYHRLAGISEKGEYGMSKVLTADLGFPSYDPNIGYYIQMVGSTDFNNIINFNSLHSILNSTPLDPVRQVVQFKNSFINMALDPSSSVTTSFGATGSAEIYPISNTNPANTIDTWSYNNKVIFTQQRQLAITADNNFIVGGADVSEIIPRSDQLMYQQWNLIPVSLQANLVSGFRIYVPTSSSTYIMQSNGILTPTATATNAASFYLINVSYTAPYYKGTLVTYYPQNTFNYILNTNPVSYSTTHPNTTVWINPSLPQFTNTIFTNLTPLTFWVPTATQITLSTGTDYLLSILPVGN